MSENSVRNRSKSLKTNEKLKTILSSILTIGNILNAGKKDKGQADGFRIDALSKAFSIQDTSK